MKDSGIMRRVDSLGRFVSAKGTKTAASNRLQRLFADLHRGYENHHPEGSEFLCPVQ